MLAGREDATIAAQVAGQLEQIYVDLGDRVKAGQELALIDTASYQALANAAAANVDRAKASADNAEANLKRVQELQTAKIASASDLDTAVAEAARTRSEIKAAEGNEAIAKLNLERSHVKAPFEGVIAARLASAGDYLSTGRPILRLVQVDPMRLRLDVPERDWVEARTGQTVFVSLEGATNTYRGQIVRIAPTIREDTRMLQVEADVPNPGDLRAGLFARAQIVVNESEQALCVPPGALVTFAGLEKVVVVRDGTATEKPVTTGRREGGWVEVVSGLAAGEKIVLDPAGIRTGQAVVAKKTAGGDQKPVTNPVR
jgi:RND family efflux transporter MFP subunit